MPPWLGCHIPQHHFFGGSSLIFSESNPPKSPKITMFAWKKIYKHLSILIYGWQSSMKSSWNLESSRIPFFQRVNIQKTHPKSTCSECSDGELPFFPGFSQVSSPVLLQPCQALCLPLLLLLHRVQGLWDAQQLGVAVHDLPWENPWFQYERWNRLCLYVFCFLTIYLNLSINLRIYLNLSESIWIYLSISIYLSFYLPMHL